MTSQLATPRQVPLSQGRPATNAEGHSPIFWRPYRTGAQSHRDDDCPACLSKEASVCRKRTVADSGRC